MEREGYEDAEKKRMMLSQPTLTGLKITGISNPVLNTLSSICCSVSSFLELVPELLNLPGVSYFLSEKLNQDPLENFFGLIRQHGRVNNNPTTMKLWNPLKHFVSSNLYRLMIYVEIAATHPLGILRGICEWAVLCHMLSPFFSCS